MQIIDRHTAKAHQLIRYFTGEPCAQGHLAERYANTGACVVCRRDNVKRWGHKNPEKIKAAEAKHRERNPKRIERKNEKAREWNKENRSRAYATNKKWRDANKEKISAFNKAWNEANRGRPRKREDRSVINKRFKEWTAKNPETAKRNRIASRVNRRTREKGNGGKLSAKDVAAIFERCSYRCIACHSTDDLELDHIIPVALSGSNDQSNFQVLCSPCNKSKGARTMEQWFKSPDSRS